MSHGRYRLLLAMIFLLLWVALAIAPSDRHDWMLENVLVLGFAAVAIVSARWIPLSRISYTLIFVFLCLHQIGAHYTYSEVPYDEWSQRFLGFSIDGALGWERNNFDRVVHFAYGLLLAYPMRELFLRVADARGFWGYFLPLDLTMSTSMLFELIEWGAAEIFGGELGAAYLGTQGDEWDAHADMALASLGALVAMLIVAAINGALQRDFAREWAESLRLKHRRPLGEDAIARMVRGQDAR
ncbi:MAG: DUF2238 domain-containing protein [Dongiaceae bacterium]